MLMIQSRRFLVLVVVLAATACRPARPGPPVELTPPDPRPVLTVNVADADEAMLLEQELDLEVVAVREGRLFFFDAPDLRERLVALGYDPRLTDPYRVFHQIVRVARRGELETLQAVGVRLLNREPDYWVVRGTLAQIRALERLGYRIGAIEEGEPRPREVRIRVASRADVDAVVALGVDVFGYKRLDDEIILTGTAFDGQIDELRDRGFTVEVLRKL